MSSTESNSTALRILVSFVTVCVVVSAATGGGAFVAEAALPGDLPTLSPSTEDPSAHTASDRLTRSPVMDQAPPDDAAVPKRQAPSAHSPPPSGEFGSSLSSTTDDDDDWNTTDDVGGRPPADVTTAGVEPTELEPTARIAPDKRYELQSQIYTVSDVVFFGYRNDTRVAIQDRNLTINQTEIASVDVSSGTYGISGSKPFSVLSGDPLTQTVSGYYATDDQGFPVSTRFKTWVPEEAFGNEKLIVFGYEDDTRVVVRNQQTGDVIANGTVGRGGHLELPVNTQDGVPANTYVLVEANKSVSALTHFDQGYYVPAASGTFTGTEFHTYASSIAASAHEVVVSGYSNGTSVEMVNSETGEVLWSGEVDAGESHAESFTTGTYVTVRTDAPASVSVQPYEEYRSSRYYHGLYVPSSSGSFIGSDFVEANTQGDHMFVFGYENNTTVSVRKRGVDSARIYTLDRGEALDVANGSGSYRIISEKPVSVHTGYSSFSAEFAPVKFGDVEVGEVSGVVRSVSGDPLADQQVFVLPMRDLYNVTKIEEFVTEDGLPDEWARRYTDDEGRFTFSPVDPGRYVVVAANQTADGNRLAYRADVLVTEGQTRRIALQYSAPLSPVDEPMERLREDYQSVLRSNGQAAADVYVTGHSEFAGETAVGRASPSNTLSASVDTLGFAIDVANDAANPKKAIAEEGAKYIAENTAFAAQEQAVDRIAITMSPPGVRRGVGSNVREIQNVEWLMQFRYVDSQEQAYERGYRNSTVHNETVASLDRQESRVDELVRTTNRSELAEDLSLIAVQEAIEKQREMVNGEGPAAGVVITPKGTVYLIEQTKEHREEFYRAKAAASAASGASTVADSISTVSGAIALVNPEPVSKSAATAVATAATGASIAADQLRITAEYKMASDYATTQVYWAEDADDIAAGYRDTVDWLHTEVENPKAHTADGEVVSTNIHGSSLPGVEESVVASNRPDWPLWAEAGAVASPVLPPGLPQYAAEKTNTVRVKNTGETSSKARIIVTDYVGKDDSPTDLPSVRPGPDEAPFTLAPGEEKEVTIPYRAQFKTLSPFEFHYQTAYLWMDGRVVDTKTDVYYIVPNLDTPADDISLPLSTESNTSDSMRAYETETPMRSSQFVYASASSDGPLTADSYADYVGNISQVVSANLTPSDPSAEATFTLANASTTENVTFLMVTESSGQVNLNVYDGVGRHVGFNPALGRDEVQIPGATYSGNDSNPERVRITEPSSDRYRVTVNASAFVTNSSASVDVYAITDPERPALLGVNPGRLSVYTSVGETVEQNVSIGEIGQQRAVTGVDVVANDFTTAAGDPLPAAADVRVASATGFDVAAGERRSVVAAVNTSGVDRLDSDLTRFNGTVDIQTDNAGSLALNASVLVLNTSDDALSLAGANRTVDGVHAARTAPDTLASSATLDRLPANATAVRGYDTRILGTGRTVFEVGELDDSVGVRAFVLVNGTWREAASLENGTSMTVSVPAAADGFVVTRPRANLTAVVATDRPTTAPAPDDTTSTQAVYPTTNASLAVFETVRGATVSNVSASVAGDAVNVSAVSDVGGEEWRVQFETADTTYNATTDAYASAPMVVGATGENGSNVTAQVDVVVRRLGDATGDGEVDIRDAVAVGRAVGTDSGDQRYDLLADVTGDGAVDAADIARFESAVTQNTTEATNTTNATEATNTTNTTEATNATGLLSGVPDGPDDGAPPTVATSESPRSNEWPSARNARPVDRSGVMP